jgi:V/A-type H+/Na+-transporting ATPase subunit E
MPEELQSLLEKINEEGIKKAEETKNRIIGDAGTEAGKIIGDARAKADEIARKAQAEADTIKSRSEAAVRQAVRDIAITLRGEILDRFKNVVKEATGDAMTPDLMGKIILEMVKNYNAKNPSGEADIELILPAKDLDAMEKLFKSGLVNSLKKNPSISLGRNFAAGVKISFKGDDVFFDFSDEAISDMICAYVGPRLAAVINPENKK